MNRQISHKELRQVLAYDPETGLLTWAVASRGTRKGDIAGTKKPDGYIRVWINGIRYAAGPLIWFWMTGHWPENEIDHCDRDPANNRWLNLREATRDQNIANRKALSKHGVKGVRFELRSKIKPWIAQIRWNKRSVYLGCFKTKDEAHQAYCVAAEQLHGEFFCREGLDSHT